MEADDRRCEERHPPPTPPIGVVRPQGRAGVCACARGHGDYAGTTASYALSSSTVTLALHPSFPRRSRDHGRSSREADQDQNRRGEAVRSRERRTRQRLLSFALWRSERPGGAQAQSGLRTPGLTWGSAAGGAGAGMPRERVGA